MKKRLLPLLLSSMCVPILLPIMSLTAQAQTTETNIASHSSFKNNLDEIQQDFYRSLRFEDWTQAGLAEIEIKKVLESIHSNSKLRDAENLNLPTFWTYEFSHAADLLQQQAQQLKDPEAAAKAYMKASTMYLIASYPNLKRPNELLALDNAVNNYVKSLQLAGDNVTLVHLPLADGTTVPGILHLPAQGSNLPAVIWSGGVDKTLIEHHTSVLKLNAEGYAVLTFDMPGAGLDYKHSLTVGALDSSHQAAFRYLENNTNIDNNRIGVLGSSGSGPALLEFALKQPKLKAIVARCSLVDGPLTNAKLLNFIPTMSVDALIARLGGDPGDKVYYAKNAANYSLATRGYFDGKARINTPLLAINTHKDPVAMPADVKKTAALSSQGEAVFFGKAGHCPDSQAASDYVINFLTKNI
ncbi:alpha/beta hydrolase [Moritella marina ATCC 15381]|uniref:Alpha/beta hydrolase n=1 Tax=Moritella marina ATCC 15381 TaxID=1202962 RepID=A0A5J6WIQ2_MORMI|nr:alpha/beta hydrolase [Moritella marina]QFI37010.1 alpha/beta hydrolase [Moritella marina ATCC 15381]